MSEPRTTVWGRTLAEVEQAVGDCLAALDRYETAFTGVLSDHHPDRPPADPAAHDFDTAWQRRLHAATEHADPVDRLLAEHEQVWGRWCEAYSAWRRSLEQAPV